MRPTFTVDLQESLELAARKMRENGGGIIPVTENESFAGAITESSLAAALAEGKELTDAVESVSHGVLTASPSTTGAEALRLFQSQEASALVVIDGSGRVLGVLAPSDLYPKRIAPPRPSMVGGMATPFGVYLTTGAIRAGAGDLALMTTGMVLFVLIAGSQALAMLFGDWLVRRGLSAGVAEVAQAVAWGLIFMVAMRSIPLSGIHAAEHKVVHAIERGEELVPSTVRRMPRVHPRCGTNLATGAILFMSLGGAGFLSLAEAPWLSYLIGGVVTLIFWRPLGNTIQYYVTTRRPTDKQLAMGIRSGRELLQKYATSDSGRAGFFRRIFNSGLLHVMAGSATLVGLIMLVALAFHIPVERYMSFGP